MNDQPKRKDYPTDDAYIEAMCLHYGIPVWMVKEPSDDVKAKCQAVWDEIARSRHSIKTSDLKTTGEPKRYEPDWMIAGTSFTPTMRECSNGEYVRYEDFDRLKEAWVDKKMQEDRDALLKKIERLIEAGDEMAAHIGNDEESQYKCADAWRAAKGVQS